MLHIIYGNDREKARARFRVLRGELIKKHGSEQPVQEGEVSRDFLEGAIYSQGLFGETTVFIFDNVFDLKETQGLLLGAAKEMMTSPNAFLLLELGLDKSTVATLKEEGVLVEEYLGKKVDTRPALNIFSLGDALGKRDKKELWILYQRALGAGFEAEEICNTLFWAVKNIILMKSAKQGDDRGVSPFVAVKARGFAKNYTEEDLGCCSRALVMAYHEAHRGGEAMHVALERFILAL